MNTSDYLVIGSGIAGLMYALNVADHGTVNIVTKQTADEGNTRYAQGGIASVTSPIDTFESHIKDTLVAGAGLCNEEAVSFIVEHGPKQISRLISLGTNFDKDTKDSSYELGREGGHSERRILHAGDATGYEIERALLEKVLAHPNIKIYPYHIGVDLIINKNTDEPTREVQGCYVLDLNANTIETFVARATMLATGGAGKAYLYTSNPDVATGDGIAMAYRAGAEISNMEFFQFHPTCLYHPAAKSFLITEAMRGEGAILRTPSGERFMENYHELKELAPRDIVARAIDDTMKKFGYDCVLLDITHRDPAFIKQRFPSIYATALSFGVDITTQPIPVVPAAHYCCGGVRTDLDGRTSLARLYAAGETACTGLHGANRLASNSLLEAVVIADSASKHTLANKASLTHPQNVEEWDYLGSKPSQEEVLVSHTWEEVRRLMWNLVGIVRSDKRLEFAQKRLRIIQQEVKDYYWRYRLTKDLVELRNISCVAGLVVASALRRKESRGLHYTLDYPKRDDDNFCKDTILTKETQF